MEVPTKTEVKKIAVAVTKERFKRLENEVLGFRRAIRRLDEEKSCLKHFKYKGGKNEV